MTEQEFADFITRVPLGARVKGNTNIEFTRPFGRLFIQDLEGVVVRHGFEFQRSAKSKHGKGTTWIDSLMVTFFDDPNEWDIRPEYLLYWIDDAWITLDALLSRNAN